MTEQQQPRDALIKARGSVGWTQEEAGQAINGSRNMIANFEAGGGGQYGVSMGKLRLYCRAIQSRAIELSGKAQYTADELHESLLCPDIFYAPQDVFSKLQILEAMVYDTQQELQMMKLAIIGIGESIHDTDEVDENGAVVPAIPRSA